jgi:predicted nucleic acid-binding protein
VTLVLDTGPVVAALNRSDPDHARCAALIEGGGDLVVPGAALVEIDYFLVMLGGVSAWEHFTQEIERGAYRVIHPTDAEIARAGRLERQYEDLGLGFVDASVIALCERLGEEKVATLDHRHFSVVRPSHCQFLTLLPT